MSTEKITFRGHGDLCLAGQFHRTDSKKGIILCHGFTGDRAEGGRFRRTAEVFSGAGYNLLRFDFSGCGESEGEFITVENQTEDLKAAVRYLKAKGINRIGLLGLSLGGLTALHACGPEISTLVLWAPATGSKKNYAKAKFGPEKAAKLEKEGFLELGRKKKNGFPLKIDTRFVHERESLVREELLDKVHCPALILHGKKDTVVPVADSRKTIALLDSRSRLIELEDEGHGLKSDIDRIILLSLDWFNSHM